MSEDEDWAKAVDEQELKVKGLQLQGQGDGKGVLTTSHQPSVNVGRGRGAIGGGILVSKVNGANAPVHPDITRTPGPIAEGYSTVPASSASTAANSSTTPAAGTDDVAIAPADASLMNKILRSRLINSKSDIEVLRSDPNSPLYHVKNFSDLRLKPELLRGLYNMGFNAPSKIQETALPALLADPPTNMIAQSQSGTGKTAAFVLTMLSRVDPNLTHTQCICLAPTYELALQIGDVTKKMAEFMPNVSIRYAIRGESYERGTPIKDQIVIGTPGTMCDWCNKFKLIDLKKVNVFVLDEADVMIDMQGHQDQSVRIQRGLRSDCQMLLFSATYDEEVMRFATHIVPKAIIIRLKREEESLDNVHQYYIECRDQQMKFEALSNIYGTITIGQSMIFCHTKRTAAWLAEEMTRQGHAVALLTGELVVEQRAAVIARFREGKEKVLITTNVSARGIDVDQVTVVVNFDLPVDQATRGVDCDTYLHRIGRTGRFGKNGLAINMIDTPQSMRMLQDIEKHFGRKISKLDAENMDEIEKIQPEYL